jgi:hypothetical protein
MPSRNGFIIAVLWVISLGVVGLVAFAQAVEVRPLPEPMIFSGDDVGFRVEAIRGGGVRVGGIVVRVNGEWVAAELGPGGVRPLQRR